MFTMLKCWDWMGLDGFGVDQATKEREVTALAAW